MGLPSSPASQRFFEEYQELSPSLAGWAERVPLLHVREHLSSIAHIGDADGDARRLRLALASFYQR